METKLTSPVKVVAIINDELYNCSVGKREWNELLFVMNNLDAIITNISNDVRTKGSIVESINIYDRNLNILLSKRVTNLSLGHRCPSSNNYTQSA